MNIKVMAHPVNRSPAGQSPTDQSPAGQSPADQSSTGQNSTDQSPAALFPPPGTAAAGEGGVEAGTVLAPKFDADGLVPCVTTDRESGGVLMVAYMNAEALALTIESGQAHYWSRSRRQIWRKGATSGHVQKVLDLRLDCDQDAVWLVVEQTGPACHVGYRSCFYRSVPLGARPTPGTPAMRFHGAAHTDTDTDTDTNNGR